MPRHPELQYLDLMRHLMEHGDPRLDRTGVGTRSTFGATFRFDLSDGTIPVITTKRVYWKLAVKEMLWFLTGGTNIRALLQQNVRIWTDWPLKKYREAVEPGISQADFEHRILDDERFAAQWGELGPVYGKQWRRWTDQSGKDHDQIAGVIAALKTNPASRRILFHAWNVPELPDMALPPCHMVYQFYVSNLTPMDGSTATRPKLNMLIFQRSCDLMLGAPFNFVGGAALMAMIAQQADLDLGELVWMGGDVHLYMNHLDQAREQVSREPRAFPTLKLLRRPDSIDGYRIEDFELTGYDPHPPIAADVAV